MSTMTHKAASLPRGRIIEISPQSLFLLNEKGTQKLDLKKIKNYPEDLKVGDWVTVENSKLLLLTPNRKSSDSLKWPTQILDPRRRHAHRIRTQVQNEIRGFFLKKAFLEVRTPLLVASPGMEPHIRPFQVHSTLSSTTNPVSYLPTSPEFAMKKLLAGGLEKIFQITPAFRDEPHSITHLPEFTLLEWYRSFCGYEQTMKDTEELVAYVAKKILKKTKVPYQSKTIDVSTPWPRYAIRSLFKKYVSLDLGLSPSSSDLAAKCQDLGTPASPNEPWDDLYFKIWLNHIEPKLPQNLRKPICL